MSPVTFLLVDDLPENLLSLEALLRREDLLLLKARSGDEALELLLAHDVALAIVDVQMPGLNGFELAELMRGNERTRRVPIIFVTAGSHSTQRRFEGYEAGAVDFIQKPIEPHVLRSKTDVFYDLYRQRQEIAAQRDILQAQAEALKEADRRKDEFLAILAHELRNPLASIDGGLKLLSRNPRAETASRITGLMEGQLSHLVRLVDDLLDISRITQGKIELRRERFSLQEAVTAAVEFSQPAIRARDHQLSVNLPELPLPLDADRVRITQCISNLLHNAAKYTPEGGQILIEAGREGPDAVVSVSDNGLGLPSHALAKIFRPFVQVDDHLDHAQGGLGIGLGLVKQLVELHGGRIRAASQGEGKGSRFSLWIPLADTPQAAVRPPRQGKG